LRASVCCDPPAGITAKPSALFEASRSALGRGRAKRYITMILDLFNPKS
jgi:hypothetical protein